MKRVLLSAVPFVLLIGLVAIAAPTPRATVSVSGASTVATHQAPAGTALILQCPGGAVWYRGMNAAELADGGSGLFDGGAFGVRADFTNQTDPIGVLLGSGQVAVALLGTDAGGSLPCFFSVP